MASLRVNKIIPLMAVSFLGMVGYLFLKVNDNGSAVSPATVSAGQFMGRAPVARTADADTPNDTIRAIRGQVDTVKREVVSAQKKNDLLLQERNKALEEKALADKQYSTMLYEKLAEQDKASSEKLDLVLSRFNSAINEMSDNIGQNYSNINNTLLDHANKQRLSVSDDSALPTAKDLMIPKGFGLGVEAGAFLSGEEMIGVFWVEPLDESINDRRDGYLAPVVTQAGDSVAQSGDSLQSQGRKMLLEPLQEYRRMLGGKTVDTEGGAQGAAAVPDDDADASFIMGGYGRASRGMVRPRRLKTKRQSQRVEPPLTQAYYTIPDLSMLSGSRAITSLVGKIYPDKTIVDPQLFKLIVGRENITANFTDLPIEIEGMIFEGYAVGDFTRKCISGNLIAATFIFEDGTIRSMYPGDPGSRPQLNDQSRSRIGYIADVYGNPCIAGKLITDAKEVLTAGAVLATLGGYSAAMRNAQTSRTERVDPDTGEVRSTNIRVDGDARKYALANGLLSGLDLTAGWFEDMYQASESAIYAPAGQTIDIHLQQELRLDITPTQRKVRYSQIPIREQYLD